MGIIDIINEKKAEHMAKQMLLTKDRERQISNLRKIEKENLEYERVKLEQAKVKQELRELKYAPIKRKFSGISKGIKKLKKFNEGREERMKKSVFLK